MAYKILIPKHKCDRCIAFAKYEVFNQRNASCGYFCARHAKEEVKELD